jgi:RHS repeat-associated protein
LADYFPYGKSSDRRDARIWYRYIGVERDEATDLLMTGPRAFDVGSSRFLQGDSLITSESPFAAPRRQSLDVDVSGYAGTRSAFVECETIWQSDSQTQPRVRARKQERVVKVAEGKGQGTPFTAALEYISKYGGEDPTRVVYGHVRGANTKVKVQEGSK